MRDKIKNIGLILALVIAGISLPIGIIGFIREPVIINNYNNNYYNTTIIEKYNTTIIEQYNYTITNNTMDFYSFIDVGYDTPFFNETYNINNNSLLVIIMYLSVAYNPCIDIWKDNILIHDGDSNRADTKFFPIIENGYYNIVITQTNPSYSDMDVDLFIGIFN